MTNAERIAEWNRTAFHEGQKMTVAKLIESLRLLDGDLQVYIKTNGTIAAATATDVMALRRSSDPAIAARVAVIS